MNRTVIQNINAPVYGHVAGGDITVIEHPPQERELTWWDLSTDELRNYLRVAHSERWRAWRRYWFNTPFFLLGLYCLGLLTLTLNMISSGHAAQSLIPTTTVPWPLWFAMINLGVMLPLGYWLKRIRRVEANVAAHTQAEIDAIELVLRRRKGK